MEKGEYIFLQGTSVKDGDVIRHFFFYKTAANDLDVIEIVGSEKQYKGGGKNAK